MEFDFSFAYEQMTWGEKVCRGIDKDHYYYIKDNQLWSGNRNCKTDCEEDSINTVNLLAEDWTYYEETPKKWTEEDIRKAKAGIELGFEWVAKDLRGSTFIYAERPYKNGGAWASTRTMLEMEKGCFDLLKWEDAEPTRLQDIVDSEVEDD